MRIHRACCGLRASPKTLSLVCVLQLVILVCSAAQQMNRTMCSVTVPAAGPVVIECSTCHTAHMSAFGIAVHVVGASAIATGLLAAYWRHQILLYVYATSMLLFAFVIGVTAVLASLEAPMLQISLSAVDETCRMFALGMFKAAENHAILAAAGCFIDTAGAILAIRSRELFTYEDIASSHAEIARAATL